MTSRTSSMSTRDRFGVFFEAVTTSEGSAFHLVSRRTKYPFETRSRCCDGAVFFPCSAACQEMAKGEPCKFSTDSERALIAIQDLFSKADKHNVCLSANPVGLIASFDARSESVLNLQTICTEQTNSISHWVPAPLGGRGGPFGCGVPELRKRGYFGNLNIKVWRRTPSARSYDRATNLFIFFCVSIALSSYILCYGACARRARRHVLQCTR